MTHRPPRRTPHDLMRQRRIARSLAGAATVVGIALLITFAGNSARDPGVASVPVTPAAASTDVVHAQIFVPTRDITFGPPEPQPPTF